MLLRQVLQIGGAIVINNDFPVVFPPQRLLALPGGGQIGQAGFAQLQSASIESIAAVDVESAPHVIHVVHDEGATVDQHRGRLLGQLLRQLVGGGCPRALQHQLTLYGVALGAGTGRQTDRLQLAALRGDNGEYAAATAAVGQAMVLLAYFGAHERGGRGWQVTLAHHR